MAVASLGVLLALMPLAGTWLDFPMLTISGVHSDQMWCGTLQSPDQAIRLWFPLPAVERTSEAPDQFGLSSAVRFHLLRQEVAM
jgi:hypothetical protein